VRRLERRALVWALLDELIPLYPLYALLFAATGLGAGAISALFAIWSLTSVLAEVPSGALADRFPRRLVIAVGELIRAAGYLLWTVAAGFGGFALGFVLWGVGGACTSGATEALLFDELNGHGAAPYLATLLGRIRAVGLLTQVPVAGVATVLFALGGFQLAGYVSVALAVLSAVAAARLPETVRITGGGEPYWETMRAGLRTLRHPAMRRMVLAVATVAGIDAIEEYFTLLAASWGISAAAVPVAVLIVPIGGAVGAALSGHRRRDGWGLLALAAGALAVAGWLDRPGGLLAVAVFYGLYRLVLVRLEVHLQERITGDARATVTSVAALATEGMCLLLYACWATGGVLAVAALVATVAGAGALGVRTAD